MKKIIATKQAPAAVGPYSQAILAGDYLFASGQIALVPETGILAEGGIEGQAKQALENVCAILKEAGLTTDHVVKTTVYLIDIADFAKVNEIYASYFKTTLPARSCVAVKELPKEALVEVEILAYTK